MPSAARMPASTGPSTSGSTRPHSPCRQKGHFGNASPNSLEGYGIAVQHLSLAKSFRITERLRTTLTGSFSEPVQPSSLQRDSLNTNISNPNPGMFTSTRPNYEPEKTSYRQVDLKLRLQF